MRVYIVRHGESVNNLNKNWTGWTDVPLTEKGRDDARKAGEFLKGITFDKVYSSDLSRAMDTARIALPGCVFETSPLFREVNVGEIGDKPLEILSVDERIAASRYGYAPYGGESQNEFGERIRRAMSMLEETSYNTVAIFAHAGFLRAFLDKVVGTYLPRQNVRCDNCAVAIFDFENKEWKLHSWINGR